MFGENRVPLSYARPRPRPRRGYGRVLLLTVALLLASARFAYGSGGGHQDRVVVSPGDSLWTIAQGHYRGDPRTHIDAIMAANRLSSPSLTPGQSLTLPQD
ncbi:MAG TPA: LysM peptidoglycan-binding domain-containing protein [Candidatus Dormibacteraeota bacterium]